MTLEQCYDAFSVLLERNLTIDGGNLVFPFETHNKALIALRNARNALAVMEGKCNATV